MKPREHAKAVRNVCEWNVLRWGTRMFLLFLHAVLTTAVQWVQDRTVWYNADTHSERLVLFVQQLKNLTLVYSVIRNQLWLTTHVLWSGFCVNQGNITLKQTKFFCLCYWKKKDLWH